MLRAQVIFICALFVLSKTLSAQNIRFNKAVEFNGGGEWGRSVLVDDDSSYVIGIVMDDSTNYIGNFWNKFDINGNLILSNGFANSGVEDYYSGFNNSLKRLSSGNYIDIGTVEKFNPLDRDMMFYKFSQEGDTILKRNYDIQNMTEGHGTLVASTNEILLIGGTYDSIINNRDVAIIKVDSLGNLIWSKKYGFGFYDMGFDAIEYKTNGYMIFCWRGYAQQFGAPWVLKLDSAGNLIQQKWFYQIPNEPKIGGGFGAVEGINKNIVIMGYYDTTTINPPHWNSFYPAFLGTMDTSMNLSILYDFVESNPSRPYIIKQIKDSSYVAVGYKENNTAGFIAKVSPAGQLLWEREYIYKEYGFNYFADFAETPDGGFIITGSTIGDLSQDMWLVKLDSLGLLNDSLIVNNGTLLANSSTNILQLYPNPTQSQLHLKIFFTQPQNEMATLAVYDMVGKQVLSESITLQQGKANHTINVSNLPSGNYIAIVQTGGEVVKQRFVRE
mgnify:CR=1 FL=1